MKNKKIVVAFVCLIVLTSLLLTTFAIQSDASKNIPKGSFTNDKAPKKREYSNAKGRKVKLDYKTSQSFWNHSHKDKYAYGKYDEYIDENKTEYYFLKDTEKLCLKMMDYEIEYSFDNGKKAYERKFNDKIVKDIADEYILSELGDSAKKYTFQKVDYREQEDTYLVTYTRKIGEYITGDLLGVFVNNEGKVYVLSATDRNRFDSFTESDIDQESLSLALSSVKRGEWKREDIRIIMDETTGKLIAELPR